MQAREIGLHPRVGGVLLEEVPHTGPRVGKENVVDEFDGRCRALDVQQDGAQRDSGTYVGPKQTG